jgi:methyl-accepting chemotaxis protein
VQLSSEKLGPVAGLLDAVLQTVSALLSDAREASALVNENVSEMHDAATSLANRAQDQNQQIGDISAVIEALATASNDITATAGEASDIASDALDVTNTGREAAERAAAGMSAVREMALQSVKKMKRLGESAQDIGEIVQMVTDFASQTNLLALNAAIEAARAGENGRGFAVVAREIRNLATSSAEATKQIHARIRGIQSETNNVVVTIEHSAQHVVMQSELATQAGSALEEVDAVMRKIATAINGINQTATRQAEAAVILATSMSGVAEISTQARESLEQMRLSMESLVERSRSLLEAISVFRLSEQDQQAGPRLLPPGPPLHPAEQATQPVPVVGGPGASDWQRWPPVNSGGLTAMLSRSNASAHPSTNGNKPDMQTAVHRAIRTTNNLQMPYTSGPLVARDDAHARRTSNEGDEGSQNSGPLSPVPDQ